MRFRPTIRQVLSSAYYRSNPLAVAKLAYAKSLFARRRVVDPFRMLELVGVDSRAAADDYAKWRPLLEQVVHRVQARGGQQGEISMEDGVFLYGVTRALKPKVVVETGVAAGVSTSFFGAALLENGVGKLYSIELPPEKSAAESYADGTRYDWPVDGPGWAIPEEIRNGMSDRHSLVLDDVRRALPRLLDVLSGLDIFFHDDLHLPDHMFWEYELVWPQISRGGALISDDADFGWVRFCQKYNLPGRCLYNMGRLCAVRKT